MEIEQQNNSPSVDPAMIIDSFIQKAEVIMVDLNSFKSFGRGESVVTTSVDWRPLWTQENKTELPLSSTQKSTILPSRQMFNNDNNKTMSDVKKLSVIFQTNII